MRKTIKNSLTSVLIALTMSNCGPSQSLPINDPNDDHTQGTKARFLTASSNTIPSDYRLEAFMIRPDQRNSLGNWRFLTEGNHAMTDPSFTIKTYNDRVEITLDPHFATLYNFQVTVDETLMRNGIHAGMSGGVAAAKIYFKREGQSGYVDPHTLRFDNSNVQVLIIGSDVATVD